MPSRVLRSSRPPEHRDEDEKEEQDEDEEEEDSDTEAAFVQTCYSVISNTRLPITNAKLQNKICFSTWPSEGAHPDRGGRRDDREQDRRLHHRGGVKLSQCALDAHALGIG